MPDFDAKTLSAKQMRAILPLGKARIVERGQGYFKMALNSPGSSTTIRIACNTAMYDLRDGDLLTLYTEVLLANPNQPPIQ